MARYVPLAEKKWPFVVTNIEMRYKEQSNVNLLLYSFVLSMFIIAQMIELSFPP